MSAKSLEQLLKEEHTVPYGKKTQGLIELYQALKQITVGNYEQKAIPVEVPGFFAVPVGMQLEHNSVRDNYHALTRNLAQPRIVMARSSDPGEMPGEFESHSSLYTPGNNEESFRDWLAAARRVRESGAGGIIGQVMVGSPEKLRDLDDEQGKGPTVFGMGNVAFYSKSSSTIRGRYPSAAFCAGLGSKIARGDDEVAIIFINRHRLDLITPKHNFHRRSFIEYKQSEIDIIMINNPQKTVSRHYPYRRPINQFILHQIGSLPFHDYVIKNRSPIFVHPGDILELTAKIAVGCGHDVEIEGCMTNEGIYLLQMNHAPSTKKTELSKVGESKVLYKTGHKEAIGANRFTGNLYISDSTVHMNPNDMLLLTTPIQKEKLSKLRGVHNIIYPFPSIMGLYEYAHQFGYAAQLFHQLEKRGIHAIGIGDEAYSITKGLGKAPKHRRHLLGDVLKITNVTAECDGTDAQIYLH
jgi:hypothetical protein